VRASAAALVLAALLAPAPLAAQVERRAGFEALVTRTHFASSGPGGAEAMSGIVAGGRARLALGPLALSASYDQGRLLADSGSAAPRDLVDGAVMLGVRPVPWLTVGAGPHLRAYTNAGGTERWVLWQARVGAEAPLIPGAVDAEAGVWVAAGITANTTPGASDARGADAGLTVHLPRSPLWARLAYTVDRARLQQGARTETLESVVLSAGFGVP
jgi:hypothetical protein